MSDRRWEICSSSVGRGLAPAPSPPLSLNPISTAAAVTSTVVVARARTTMSTFALVATAKTVFFVLFNLLRLSIIRRLKLHPFPSGHYSQLVKLLHSMSAYRRLDASVRFASTSRSDASPCDWEG
jgi:hypothetical protein